MKKFNGAFLFVYASAVIMLGASMLWLVLGVFPKNGCWMLIIYGVLAGIGVICSALSLFKAWCIAKSIDEKNEDKLAGGIQNLVMFAIVAIVCQIVALAEAFVLFCDGMIIG